MIGWNEKKDIHFKETKHMVNDNTTPMTAEEYDKKINDTIPYYPDFYDQTLDLVRFKCFGIVTCRWGFME